MRTLTLAAFAALSLPLAATAQSTSGSSGAGTSEPGPSAAEASGFGNTGRSPSVTGSNDSAPRGTGSSSKENSGASVTTFHGSAITADALFRSLDTDGDGKLSREEFAKITAVMGKGSESGSAADKINRSTSGTPTHK